jgi:hypothetical protein
VIRVRDRISLLNIVKDSNINLDEIKKISSDLTTAIQQIQTLIDQTTKNKHEYYIRLQGFNEKLIEFERLFIIDDQLHRTNTADETSK